MVKIELREIASRTTTRARGTEAFYSLREHLPDHGDIELDLAGQELVSLSFLDEVVRLLGEDRLLSRVAFIADDEEITDKLGKISGIRGLAVRCRRSGDPEAKLLPPIAPLQVEILASQAGPPSNS